MRQFAGFGTLKRPTRCYKALLQAGGTGLSVAFDLPTLMGRDPVHELSLGEVGKWRREHGVASPTWRCSSTASTSVRSRRR